MMLPKQLGQPFLSYQSGDTKLLNEKEAHPNDKMGMII